MATQNGNSGKGSNTNSRKEEAMTTVNRQEVEVIVKTGLQDRGITALKGIARDLGVKGFSKFKKGEEAQLIALIQESCGIVMEDEELNNQETEPATKKGGIEAQAQAFMQKKHMKENAMTIVQGKPKVYSEAVNPISENDSKIRLHGLSPEMVEVEGLVYTAILNDDGTYRRCKFERKPIEVAKFSPFAQWAINGDIMLITIDESDAAKRLYIYEDIQRDAYKNAKMYVIGNGKKSEPLLGAATREMWKKLTGDDVFTHDNPNKPLGCFMSPENYKIARVDNSQYIRARVIDDEFTEKTVLQGPKGNKVRFGGHPLNDGNMIFSGSIFSTQVGELRRAHEAEKEYSRKIRAGQTAKQPKPAKERRVTQAQVRNYCVVDESLHQLMIECHAIDPSYVVYQPNEVQDTIKVKIKAQRNAFEYQAQKHGFELSAQDAFIGLGNFKTRKGHLKHGDIVLMPINTIRFINVKVSDGKSSLGVQCVRLDTEFTRQIIATSLHKADNVVGAVAGDAESYKNVLQSDTEASMDDAVSEPLRSLGCAILDQETKTWRMPMYKSRYNVVLARVWTYLTQHVYKVRLSDYAFYLECNEELDKKEQQHFQETGEFKYFFNAPTKKKIMNDAKANKYWNIGRNPIVGPGNFMGFLLNDYNGTTDVVEVSCRALWTMFGDVDGDTCVIFPHNEIYFPPCERPLPQKGEKSPKPEMTPDRFNEQCINAMAMILQSARDTGALDNLSRQIMFERMEAGEAMSMEEVMEMGVIVQQAIDGMKHSDQGAEEDSASYITRKFGYNGRVRKLAATVHAFKALRKDGGISEIGGLPRQSMEAICRELQQVENISLNPYNDMLQRMKGIKPAVIEHDSKRMQDWCKEEWERCVKRHTDSVARGNKPGAFFGWTPENIRAIGEALMFGAKNYYGIKIEGYSICTRMLSRMTELQRDKKLRRKRWALLTEEYQEYIEMAAQDWTSHQPEEVRYRAVAEFKYQLMCYIGTRSFGVSSTYDEFNNPILVSRAGSLFWVFPKFDCVLRFLKQVNPDNPFMELVEEAVKENMRKQLEREAMELQARADSQGF